MRGGKTESLLKTIGYISRFKKSSQKFIDKILASSSKFTEFALKIPRLQQRFFSEEPRVSHLISKIRALFVSSSKNFGGRDVPSRFRKENLSEGERGFFRFIDDSAEHGGAAKRFREKFSERGAILIEFAVAMPVLIILMMYIHDLALMKRYYDQMEFVALQMVNMIQNVSQKRTDKAVTINDFRRITCASYLTIYPGTTMYAMSNDWAKHYFVHFPHPSIYYVKGNANGTASCVWASSVHVSTGNPTNVGAGNTTADEDITAVRYKTNVTPSQIWPTLKINPGEVKIIVDAFVFFNRTYKDVNGKSGHSIRQVFGFYLLTPKYYSNYGKNTDVDRKSFFHSVVIFSPKPGLFSETPPK